MDNDPKTRQEKKVIKSLNKAKLFITKKLFVFKNNYG